MPTTATPRRARPTRAERRSSIRHAAYLSFKDQGYHGTTIDHVCELAGISKGSFYTYFQSKHAVFVDIVEQWAAAAHGEMTLQFKAAMSASDPISAALEAVGREARRSRQIFPVWLELLSEAGRDPETRQVLATFHQRVRHTLSDILETALDDRVSRHEVSCLAGSAMALFFGLLSQEFTDHDGAPFDQQLQGCVSVLRRAVGAPALDPRGATA